ncbi:DUF6492 family protein [Bacillus sp. EB600]|uniref:DUF6492 family protein n=1 Tax=Bacillus sp. EB600 TaxID=2806345 RepID=UPI00210D141B|nr:DUF6492 family protein [Bacillus sp. EB600]MCQ6280444.1 hypothetical protein [Bacillus sp. EB600]
MDNNKTFDVIIPVAKEDLTLAIINIPYIIKMLSPEKIIFIGSKEIEDSIPSRSPSRSRFQFRSRSRFQFRSRSRFRSRPPFRSPFQFLSRSRLPFRSRSPFRFLSRLQHNEKLEFMNEDEIYHGMTFNTIQSIMNNITGTPWGSGWYLQQFLKMAYATICKNEHYVVWDSDTIPLNVISFFDDQTDKYLFTMKTEYHKPYFATIEKLFNGEVKKYNNQSFIAEHMIMDTKIMIELINKIESNKQLKGNYFYEKIMYAINPKDIQRSGFSEYETYGNYVMKYYSNKYIMRKLKSLREARQHIGFSPTDDDLLRASKDFDLISFENW